MTIHQYNLVAFTVLVGIIGALWWEIRTLRRVRHEDREAITRSRADIDILLHDYKQTVDDYKELIDKTLERVQDLERENHILKYLLKTAGVEVGSVSK